MLGERGRQKKLHKRTQSRYWDDSEYLIEVNDVAPIDKGNRKRKSISRIRKVFALHTP
jgi:hypothetical protein